MRYEVLVKASGSVRTYDYFYIMDTKDHLLIIESTTDKAMADFVCEMLNLRDKVIETKESIPLTIAFEED